MYGVLASAVTDRQHAGCRKACVAAQAVGGGPGQHIVYRCLHKACALRMQALHHGGAIDLQALGVYAKHGCATYGTRGFAGGNQELAGHATHAGAHGAVGAAFDHHDAVRVLARCFVGAHASGAGTDDGDIYVKGRGAHGAILCLQTMA